MFNLKTPCPFKMSYPKINDADINNSIISVSVLQWARTRRLLHQRVDECPSTAGSFSFACPQ